MSHLYQVHTREKNIYSPKCTYNSVLLLVMQEINTLPVSLGPVCGPNASQFINVDQTNKFLLPFSRNSILESEFFLVTQLDNLSFRLTSLNIIFLVYRFIMLLFSICFCESGIRHSALVLQVPVLFRLEKRKLRNILKHDIIIIDAPRSRMSSIPSDPQQPEPNR